MKPGIYYICFDDHIDRWKMLPNMDNNFRDVPLGQVGIKVKTLEYHPFSYNRYYVYLDAIDPVSAFTIGFNLIRDKMED